MFIALYEFQVKDGQEKKFKKAWLRVSEGIYQQCGSLGSRLHSSQIPHIFIGYAQWPDKKTWSNSEAPSEQPYQKAAEDMRDCLIRSKTLYEMEVQEDYLRDSVFKE